MLEQYLSYKETEHRWLPEVPSHWEVLPAKRHHSVIKKINNDGAEENVLSLTLRGVVNNDRNNPCLLYTSDAADE